MNKFDESKEQGALSGNVFRLAEEMLGKNGDEEIFVTLAEGEGMRLEQIISTGQVTPDGQWYDQEWDEWVILVQGEAEITFFDGKVRTLKAGDWVFLPKNLKHKVSYTSDEPCCVWLALHGNMNLKCFSNNDTTKAINGV